MIDGGLKISKLGLNPNKYECIYFDERYTKVPKMAFLDKKILDKKINKDYTTVYCYYPISVDTYKYEYRISKIGILSSFNSYIAIPYLNHPSGFGEIPVDEDTDGIDFNHSNSFGIFNNGMLYIFDIKNGRYDLVRTYNIKSELYKNDISYNISYGFYIVDKDLKECKLVLIGLSIDFRTEYISIFKLNPYNNTVKLIAKENMDSRKLNGFVYDYSISNDDISNLDYIIAFSYYGSSPYMSVITLNNDRNNTNNDKIYTKKFGEFNKVCAIKIKSDKKNSEPPNFNKYGADIYTIRNINKKNDNGNLDYYLSYAKMSFKKDKGFSSFKTIKDTITNISDKYGKLNYVDSCNYGYPYNYIINRITNYYSGYSNRFDCIFRWNDYVLILNDLYDRKLNYKAIYLENYMRKGYDINYSTTVKGIGDKIDEIHFTGVDVCDTIKNTIYKIICNDYVSEFSGLIEKNSMIYENENISKISKIGDMFGLCRWGDDYALLNYRAYNVDVGIESKKKHINIAFGEYLNINEQLKEKIHILNLH